MKYSITSWLINIYLLISMSTAAANDFALTIPEIDVATNSIIIDAKLDEPVWQKAKKVPLLYVTSPYENTTPPVKTTAYIFENGDTLFVAFEAQAPVGDKPAAFYQDRDKIWSHDLVGLKLDTFNNERLAYQFFINPYGIQADSIENEITGSESDSWNAIWYSAGDPHENGYRVELAIPFKALNFADSDGIKTWRAEFVRFYPRDQYYRISNLTMERGNPCNLCQMGEIKGFENIQQSENLVWVPTAVVGASRSKNETTGNWQNDNNQELGLDVNWAITPQSILQATFNPDFSQVEADVAQISINNTFSLSFNELRPFFVENAEYFSTNQNLVYTRNVNAPNLGAKYTGQAGNHTLGVFVADDDTTQFVVPGNLGSTIGFIDEESINGALRYRYDFDQNLSVGFLSTLRSAGEYHNYVAAIDGKYLLTPNDAFKLQITRSDTQYPTDFFSQFCDEDCSTLEGSSESGLRTIESENFSGSAISISYQHSHRDYWVFTSHSDYSEGFRADLGFQSRTDFTKSVLGGGYNWWNEKSWWNRIQLSGDWDITHNQAGELIEKEWEVYLSVRGAMQSYVELQYLDRTNRGQRQNPTLLSIDNNATLFHEWFYALYGEIRPIPEFEIEGFVRFGEVIDFANNRVGDQFYVNMEMDWNIGKHMKLGVLQIYSELDSADKSLFKVRLTDLRMTYQFNPRHFLRLIVSYNNTDRNPANYPYEVEAKSKDLSAQLLYSYKLDPLTKFFIGIGQAAENTDTYGTLETQQQSAFMKISYAWQ